jgi:glyoxylase-like metal-dependent hydrolase (beta-lactamase superfamily II)
MARLAETGLAGGGEGVDRGFRPDATLADGAVLETPAGPVRALHTPGHFSNHLCFAWGGAVFTGDTVMGWATSLVSMWATKLARDAQTFPTIRSFTVWARFSSKWIASGKKQARASINTILRLAHA